VSRRADEVRQEIQQTQAQLGSTLEEIGDRVAPKKVVRRAKGEIAGRVDDVKEKVSPARRARGALRRVRETVMGSEDDGGTGDGYGSTSGRVRGQADALSQRAGSAAGTVAEKARRAPAAAQGNPLAVGLLSFGAGFLAASLLPATDRERQVADQLKDQIEPLKQRAVETGREVADELRQTAESGAEQVKRRATDAAETVKEEGRSRAQRTKGRAQKQVEEVKGQAKGATKQVKGRATAATSRVKGEGKQASKTVKKRATSGAAAPA